VAWPVAAPEVGHVDAERVARQHGTGLRIDEGHVVGRMAGRVQDLEIPAAQLDALTVLNRFQTVLGDRLDGAKPLGHPLLPVDTGGAGHQLGRVGEMRCPSLVDPDR